MWQQIFLGLLGLCSGTIIASGVAGLLIGLSIIPRYAGITHTADHILLYEDMCFLGIFLGNLFLSFPVPPASGNSFFTFIRCVLRYFPWRMDPALAEVADMFPVFTRRIRLTQGLPLIILFIALGKLTGTLFFYYFGWQ